MKVKITIEKNIEGKISIEHRIIEMDEKFRQCASPWVMAPDALFREAAYEASEILGLPLAADVDEAPELILSGRSVDNGELIFEM